MKTATELGITDEELAALLIVRDNLSNGTFVHQPKLSDDLCNHKRPVDSDTKPYFNMGLATTHGHCGSVGCIGGWVATILYGGKIDAQKMADNEVSIDGYVANGGENGTLDDLFYPPFSLDKWDDITPAQAAKAIDNLLHFGDPHWDQIAEEVFA